MTYSEAIQFLYDLQVFGARFGLDTTRKLAALAGNPHEKLRFIHVAGTNGKGSTCAMLEGIYRHAGLKVGLFTSPHLVRFGERVQVNRELISEADIVRLVEPMHMRLREFSQEDHPTFFEVITVMALQYFAEQQCELVIWETGLGGRLDATNIVTPLASVITNIDLDHQKWLGDTLAQIASEKAGIIKPGIPVITAVTQPEAFDVIAKKARDESAPLTRLTDSDTRGGLAGTVKLPLLGRHQRWNAALAEATVRQLQSKIAIKEEAIRCGLEFVQWAGRGQVVESNSQRTVVVDGAHNSAGALALSQLLRDEFPGIHPLLLLGMMKDKDCAKVCHILAPLAREIIVTPVSSPRSILPVELASFCRQANPHAEVFVTGGIIEALATSYQRARLIEKSPLIVITGSLYLIGEALEVMESETRSNELGLNDWTQKRDG